MDINGVLCFFKDETRLLFIVIYVHKISLIHIKSFSHFYNDFCILSIHGIYYLLIFSYVCDYFENFKIRP